jgi:hypothetical protein
MLPAPRDKICPQDSCLASHIVGQTPSTRQRTLRRFRSCQMCDTARDVQAGGSAVESDGVGEAGRCCRYKEVPKFGFEGGRGVVAWHGTSTEETEERQSCKVHLFGTTFYTDISTVKSASSFIHATATWHLRMLLTIIYDPKNV